MAFNDHIKLLYIRLKIFQHIFRAHTRKIHCLIQTKKDVYRYRKYLLIKFFFSFYNYTSIR